MNTSNALAWERKHLPAMPVVAEIYDGAINAMLAAEDAPMQKQQGLCQAIDGEGLWALVQV